MDPRAPLAATWPALETAEAGGFLLRRGAGGGRRVSAALLRSPDWSLAEAESLLADWNQPPCFQIWPGEDALDAALAGRGYALRDPTLILEAPGEMMAAEAFDERTIFCAAPLACMEEIWRAAGIGPARLAVMTRAPGPKTFLLGRLGDRPEGCAFVALAGQVAFLHALEVRALARRHGLARQMTRAAAAWAGAKGATRLLLAVREGNTAAIALNRGLGFTEISRYHYREKPGD